MISLVPSSSYENTTQDAPTLQHVIVRANASYTWLFWVIAKGAKKEFLSYST
jgi:hypothetical protein